MTQEFNEPTWRKNLTLALEITGLVALIVYTCFSGCQWKVANDTLTEIRNGKTDTNRIITASETQADASTSFSNSAQEQAAAAKKAADSTAALAKQAKRSADLTEEAMQIQSRPWIGIDPVGGLQVRQKSENDAIHSFCEVPRYYAVFVNFGHSPALEATTEMEERVFEQFPTDPPYATNPAHIDRITIVPGIPITNQGAECQKVSAQDAKEIREVPVAKKHLYIYGRVLYQDQFRKTVHQTTFCFYSLPMNPIFAACPTYNGAD